VPPGLDFTQVLIGTVRDQRWELWEATKTDGQKCFAIVDPNRPPSDPALEKKYLWHGSIVYCGSTQPSQTFRGIYGRELGGVSLVLAAAPRGARFTGDTVLQVDSAPEGLFVVAIDRAKGDDFVMTVDSRSFRCRMSTLPADADCELAA